MADDEVAARLVLKDRGRFSSEAKAAAHDVDNIGSAADKAGKKAASSSQGFGLMSKGIRGLSTIAKVGVTGLAGLTAGIAAIGGKEAMDAQKVNAQTAAVIRSTHGAANVTAGSLDSLAGSIANVAGKDDEAVKAGGNLLLTFTNVKNGVGAGNDIFNQALPLIADMSQAMGTDMSKGAIQVGKALNDPVKGVTALRKVGVSFTAAQIDSIKAMVDSGHTMDAQRMILKELRTEFGGSAEAYGKTLPGVLSRAKEAFKNAAGGVVGSILNLIQPAIGGLADRVSGFADRVQAVMPGVQDAFSLGTALKPWNVGMSSLEKRAYFLGGAFNRLGQRDVAGFARSLAQAIVPGTASAEWVNRLLVVGRQLGNILTTAVVPALSDVGRILPVFLSPLRMVVPLIGFLSDHAKGLRGVLVALVIAYSAWRAAIMVTNGVLAVQRIRQELADAETARSIVVTKAASAAQKAASLTARGLAGAAKGIWSGMKLAGQGLAGAAKGAAGMAQSLAKTAAESAKTIVVTLRSAAVWAAARVQALAVAAAQKAWAVAQWALNAAMNANPITLLVVAVVALIAGLVLAYQRSETFRNIVQGAFSMVMTAARWVIDFFRNNWPLLLAILVGPVGIAVLAIIKHWDTIKGAAGTAVDFVKGVFSGFIDFWTGMPGRLLSVGGHMFDFVKTAFKGAINWVIRAWNHLEFKIPGFDPPGPGPKFSGFTLGMPDIHELHMGGMTTSEGMVKIRPDEEVVSLPARASVVPLQPDTGADDDPVGWPVMTAQVVLDGKVLADATFAQARDRAARR